MLLIVKFSNAPFLRLTLNTLNIQPDPKLVWVTVSASHGV